MPMKNQLKKTLIFALDVYKIEPPTNKNLIELENLICTPHTRKINEVLAFCFNSILTNVKTSF